MLRASRRCLNRAEKLTMRTAEHGGYRAFIVAAALLAASAASATPKGGELRIDWSTIDAGGGNATGGTYSISGTIGQVDADPLQPASGGAFELTGGFWVIDAAPPSDQVFRDGFE